jgi:hypothetical protein
MKTGILLILLLVMVSVLGCEKKETMSITGPSGQKASVTFPK